MLTCYKGLTISQPLSFDARAVKHAMWTFSKQLKYEVFWDLKLTINDFQAMDHVVWLDTSNLTVRVPITSAVITVGYINRTYNDVIACYAPDGAIELLFESHESMMAAMLKYPDLFCHVEM